MMREAIGVFFWWIIPLIICQGQITSDTILLPQMEVKAERPLDILDGSGYLMEQKNLNESKSFSLAEILSRYTSVFIKTYGVGGLATASFRGTTASHTKVFWEGMNINSPMAGQSDLSLFPAFFIDQLSVYPGSASLNLGGGALGGAVAINSKADWTKKNALEFMLEGGSFSLWKGFMKVRHVFGKSQLSLRVFGDRAENNFPFLNTASGTFETVRQYNADFIKGGGLLDFYHLINNRNNISCHLWVQKGDRNLPPIMSYAGIGRKEFQIDEEIRFVTQWKHFSEKFSSILKLGVAQIGNVYHLSNETPLGTVINYDSDSEMTHAFVRWDGQLQAGNTFLLKIRTESRLDFVEIFDKRSMLGYDASRTTTTLQISGHKAFGKVLTYVLLQQNIVSDNSVPLIYGSGIEWTIQDDESFILGSNFSKNYNIPSLNDLYWIPGGNADLRPENGYNGDIVLKYKVLLNKRLRGEIHSSVFAGLMNDWIMWIPGEFRFWTAENVQRVFLRGLEANAKISCRMDWGWLTLGSLYSFTKTTDETRFSGAQLIYIPVHKGNIYFDATFGKWSGGYTIEYTGERFTNPDNRSTRHRLPGFYLHAVNVQRKVEFSGIALNLIVRVNNLMDKSYQAILWRAMPGRYFNLAINLTL